MGSCVFAKGLFGRAVPSGSTHFSLPVPVGPCRYESPTLDLNIKPFRCSQGVKCFASTKVTAAYSSHCGTVLGSEKEKGEPNRLPLYDLRPMHSWTNIALICLHTPQRQACESASTEIRWMEAVYRDRFSFAT